MSRGLATRFDVANPSDGGRARGVLGGFGAAMPAPDFARDAQGDIKFSYGGVLTVVGCLPNSGPR